MPGAKYLATLLSAKGLFLVYVFAQAMTVIYGMGMMGISHPVGWGTDIITFVFWIGIGHAGTLISAILILIQAKMANGHCQICRSHDGFCCDGGGYFPSSSHWSSLVGILVAPVSESRGPLWVNFRSPLVWDVFAVSTYATVSIGILVHRNGSGSSHHS